MSGFPDHVIDAAFGPDALAATHRRAEQQREQQPRWLAGLIAKHGEPVTFQPEPITLGASRFQTWAWVGCGVQVEQTLSTWTVSAHRRGRLARLAGLKDYPTDAEISGVVALAGLDDAPAPVPGSPHRAQDVIEETDYIHTYFGLSYSAYQVLPRTLMQSMPAEWQKRMVTCLEELRDAFRHIEHADVYEVTAAVECYYDELTEADMKALGITRPDAPDGDDEDADLPNVYYDRDGTEHDSHERVLVPRPGGDPIPHYNRGRTHIEPRIAVTPDRAS